MQSYGLCNNDYPIIQEGITANCVSDKYWFFLQLCISSPRPAALELASSVQYSARAGGVAWLSAAGHHRAASASRSSPPGLATDKLTRNFDSIMAKMEPAEVAAQNLFVGADFNGYHLQGDNSCPDSKFSSVRTPSSVQDPKRAAVQAAQPVNPFSDPQIHERWSWDGDAGRRGTQLKNSSGKDITTIVSPTVQMVPSLRWQ